MRKLMIATTIILLRKTSQKYMIKREKYHRDRKQKQLEGEIESSKDKIFIIKHISAGSTQAQWYLIQVDMDQSDMVSMRDFGVYQCRWYIRHQEDCTQNCTMECRFWMDIREINQDGTCGKMLSVRSFRLNSFL